MTATWIPFAFICKHDCTYSERTLAFVSGGLCILLSVVGAGIAVLAGKANALYHKNGT